MKEDIPFQRRSAGSLSRRRSHNAIQESNKAIYDALELVLRHKWKVIIPFILATPLAIALAYSLPSLYRSSTLILVERQQVPQEYVRATDTSSVSERLSTIKQQILSRTKLEQIIGEFHLFEKKPEQEATLLFRVHRKLRKIEEAWQKKGGLFLNLSKLLRVGIWALDQEGSLTREEEVEKMRESIEVTVIGGSGRSRGDAFTVSFVGKNPQTTMEVTNKIASLFIEENLKLREQYAEGTSEFLENELGKSRQELEEQEKKVQVFKQRHMGSLPEQLDANLRTLDRLQLGLQSATDAINIALQNKEMLKKQIDLASSTPTASLTPLNPLLPFPAPRTPPPTQIAINLERLKAELASLLSVYKENYPDVITKRKQIEELEKLMAKEKESEEVPIGQETIVSATTTSEEEPETETPASQETVASVPVSQEELNLASLETQIKNLRKREAEIRKAIKVHERRVEAIPINEQQLASIRRDYEISQQNYQSLLEKKLNAKLAENLEKKQKGERFRIIDSANFPEKPFKPNRPVIILLGMAVGPGIGLGLIFLLDFLNPSFKSPEDFEGVIPQPVLAVIPTIPSPEETAKTKS